MVPTSHGVPGGPSSDDLGPWLERVIAHGCTRVILRQRNSDAGTEQVVTDFPIREVRDVQALAVTVMSRALDDARFATRSAVYVVYAYRDLHQLDRKHLDVGTGDVGAPGVTGLEAPTISGLTSMMMRHYEANARMSHAHALDMLAHYRAQVAAKDKRIAELEAKQEEISTLYAKLRSMEHEREYAKLQAQREDRRAEFFSEKFNLLLPILVNKLGGGGDRGPTKPILGEELVRQLASSIDEAQMEALMKIFRPEQAAAFFELYLAYGQREVHAKGGGASTSPGAPSAAAASTQAKV